MLTSDLIRATVKGKTLRPGLVKASEKRLIEAATTLLEVYGAAAERNARRVEIADAIDTVVNARTRPKVLRGLAKLLQDRSTFEIQCPIPPSELRKRVFLEARARGPLTLDDDLLDRPTADQVLADVGAELSLTVDQVREALYADLSDNQRITEVKVPSAEWLLHRYNVSQVQSLLLRTVELQVTLHEPTAARMRQLFRYVKFHRLMHRAKRTEKTLELTLDGPTSLFAQSTRYGMQLANFLPALLLQDGDWSMEATVLWTKAKHRKSLQITPKTGLRSHYADRGAYQTQEQVWFQERFNKLDSGWKLTEGQIPIDLGGRGVVFPDFTFKKGRKTAHLEILGFWRHDDLSRKLELIDRYGPGNLILAVSKQFKGSKEALVEPPPWVIQFAKVIQPKQVLVALEAKACR